MTEREKSDEVKEKEKNQGRVKANKPKNHNCAERFSGKEIWHWLKCGKQLTNCVPNGNKE